MRGGGTERTQAGERWIHTAWPNIAIQAICILVATFTHLWPLEIHSVCFQCGTTLPLVNSRLLLNAV